MRRDTTFLSATESRVVYTFRGSTVDAVKCRVLPD